MKLTKLLDDAIKLFLILRESVETQKPA